MPRPDGPSAPPAPRPALPGGHDVTPIASGSSISFHAPYDGSGAGLHEVRIREGFRQPRAHRINQNYTVSGGHARDFEVVNGVPQYAEGLDYAACGSSAVAAELARRGYFATTEGVDAHMRARMQLGGSLLGGSDYLRRAGLAVEQRHEGTWSELRTALEQGYGVIVTFAHESSDHTVELLGMFTGEDGKEYVEYQEWSATDDGTTRFAISREVFERNWNEVTLNGLSGPPTGIRRTYTLVAPEGTTQFPPGGSVWGDVQAATALTLLDSWHQITISTHYFAEGEVLGGSARMLAGLTQGLVQLPAGALFALGASVEWLSRRGADWCERIMQTGSDVEKVFAAIAWAFLRGFQYLFFAVRQVAQVLGWLTSLPARLISWPFKALADWARDDNDAVTTLRYARPDGTRRERENWRALVATPVVPGKVSLVRRMLDGHISAEERAMTLRVIEATLRDERATEDTKALVNAIGRERLSAVFAGSESEARWRQYEALLDAPVAPAPIARLHLDAVPSAGPGLAAPRLRT